MEIYLYMFIKWSTNVLIIWNVIISVNSVNYNTQHAEYTSVSSLAQGDILDGLWNDDNNVCLLRLAQV